MLDYFNKPQTINHFYGPIIEFAQPVPIAALDAYLAKKEIFPRVVGRKDIKFFRITMSHESLVRHKNMFSVCLYGGVTVHHLVDLRNEADHPARQYVVFDGDAEVEDQKIIVKDASEFDTVARTIVKTSGELIRLHNGVVPKNRWDADVGLQVLDKDVARHFNMSGEVIGIGEKKTHIRPVRKIDSGIRHQKLDLVAANDSELKAG